MSTQDSIDNPASPKPNSSFTIESLITRLQSNDSLVYDGHVNTSNVLLDYANSNRTTSSSPTSIQTAQNDAINESNWYHRGSFQSEKTQDTNKLKTMESKLEQL
jgi:hypothetical protein